MKGERKLKATVLQPGMHIVDTDFHGYNGVTKFSLQFWAIIKDMIKPVVQARMMFTREDWYRFILTTEDNVEIEFTGFAAGYSGEGPRGLEKVLSDCGFDSNIAFEKETFILTKIGEVVA